MPNPNVQPDINEDDSDFLSVQNEINIFPSDGENYERLQVSDLPIADAIMQLLTTVFQNQKSLVQQFANLQNDFISKIKYDQSQQTIIDSLHKDLQVNRDGLHYKILKPLFIDLIHLYDDMAETIQTKPDADGMSDHEQKIWKGFEDFQKSIEDTLYRHGVELFHEGQDIFVPKTQQIRKKTPTNQHNLDRCIADRLKPGFIYEDSRILRPEIVAIYQYQPQEGDNY